MNSIARKLDLGKTCRRLTLNPTRSDGMQVGEQIYYINLSRISWISITFKKDSNGNGNNLGWVLSKICDLWHKMVIICSNSMNLRKNIKKLLDVSG